MKTNGLCVVSKVILALTLLSLVKAFANTEPKTSHAISAVSSIAQREENDEVFHLYDSPNGQFAIAVKIKESGIFISLCAKPDNKILQTWKPSDIRSIKAIWSPDSSLVAISWNEYGKFDHLAVFHVKETRWQRLKLEEDNSPQKLLPRKDRDFSRLYMITINDLLWKDNTHLKCSYRAMFQEIDSEDEKRGNLSTEGYFSILYDVMFECGAKTTKILSTRLMDTDKNGGALW
ncbi:MAG: hypothetical protein ABI443_09965 [Chthoniobacterales bacterium]